MFQKKNEQHEPGDTWPRDPESASVRLFKSRGWRGPGRQLNLFHHFPSHWDRQVGSSLHHWPVRLICVKVLAAESSDVTCDTLEPW